MTSKLWHQKEVCYKKSHFYFARNLQPQNPNVQIKQNFNRLTESWLIYLIGSLIGSITNLLTSVWSEMCTLDETFAAWVFLGMRIALSYKMLLSQWIFSELPYHFCLSSSWTIILFRVPTLVFWTWIIRISFRRDFHPIFTYGYLWSPSTRTHTCTYTHTHADISIHVQSKNTPPRSGKKSHRVLQQDALPTRAPSSYWYLHSYPSQ